MMTTLSSGYMQNLESCVYFGSGRFFRAGPVTFSLASLLGKCKLPRAKALERLTIADKGVPNCITFKKIYYVLEFYMQL